MFCVYSIKLPIVARNPKCNETERTHVMGLNFLFFFKGMNTSLTHIIARAFKKESMVDIIIAMMASKKLTCPRAILQIFVMYVVIGVVY